MSYHERRRRGRRSNQTGPGSELDSIEAVLDHFGSPGDLRQMEDLMIMQAIRLSMLEAEAGGQADVPEAGGAGGADAAAPAPAAVTVTTPAENAGPKTHDDAQLGHPLALSDDVPLVGSGGGEGGGGQSAATASVATTDPAPRVTELPAGQAAASPRREQPECTSAPEAAAPASALRSLLSGVPDTAEVAVLLDEERQLRLAIAMSLQDSPPGDELDTAGASVQAAAARPPLDQAGGSGGGQDEAELDLASSAGSPGGASDQSSPSADRRGANSASPADSLGATSNCGSEDIDLLGAFKFEQELSSTPAEVEVELHSAPPVRPGGAAVPLTLEFADTPESFDARGAAAAAAAAAPETCDEPATEADLLPRAEASTEAAAPAADSGRSGSDAGGPLCP